MTVPATRWTHRQACEAAGLTRGVVRGLVDDFDFPAQLDALDIVGMRCLAFVRGAMFPGEKSPQRSAREPRRRELQLLDRIREVGSGDFKEGAHLLVTADEVAFSADLPDLMTAALQAGKDGEPFISIPVGRWLLEQGVLPGVAPMLAYDHAAGGSMASA